MPRTTGMIFKKNTDVEWCTLLNMVHVPCILHAIYVDLHDFLNMHVMNLLYISFFMQHTGNWDTFPACYMIMT